MHVLDQIYSTGGTERLLVQRLHTDLVEVTLTFGSKSFT